MGVDELLDGLDDDVEQDIKPRDPAKRGYPFATYERCLVLQVTEGRYTSAELYAESMSSGARAQKVVRIYSQTASLERTVLLRGRWYPTPVRVGDYMNIVGTIPERSTEVVIDDSSHHLMPILHPDTLVSSTHLSDAYSCIRRAVLRDRVREIRDDGPTTPVMLIGTLLHDLFQSCAQKNQWDDKAIEDTVWQLIASSLERLWECGIDENSAFKQVIECKGIYQDWARKYMHGSAEQGAPFTLSSNASRGEDADNAVSISKVLAIEENVWSPKFGLNGKIDLTIQTKYRDGTTL
ncbi:DNA replication endonuclease-helicase Dna2, partial [Linderina pennispora]